MLQTAVDGHETTYFCIKVASWQLDYTMHVNARLLYVMTYVELQL